MFIGSYENMRRVALRIREAAIQLKVKRIVFGECGHAWRVAYSFLNTWPDPGTSWTRATRCRSTSASSPTT
jgi:hypothetical protein